MGFADKFKNKGSNGGNDGTTGDASGRPTFTGKLQSSNRNTIKPRDKDLGANATIDRTMRKGEDRAGDHKKKFRASLSRFVYLVRGIDRTRNAPAWHYILVDRDKLDLFKARISDDDMDIADYGEILYSGWGENPPQDIVDKIDEEFSA